MKSLLLATAALSIVAAPALAAPQVAVDILPVHSLVSRVMDGVGEPTLVVPPGASPHGYAMRPSEAAAVQNADVIFWIGEELSPALARSIESLGGEANKVSLLNAPDTVRLEFREGATFEAHDHGEDHDGHDHEDASVHDDHGDDHGHEETAAHDDHGDDHGHTEAAAHDDHGHEHEEAAAHGDDGHGHEEAGAHDDHDHGHDHTHDGVDPHAWLDPQNAKVWVDAIAGALSQADPENASTYFSNAAAAKDELDTLIAEVAETVEPIRGRNFVVFHDAYHYFEARFDVEAAGAISLGDAAQPSAARVAEIKDAISDMNAACVFSEPQFEPRLVQTVIEGTDTSTGVLDPLGADLAPGPDLYPNLIRNLADNLVACLRPAS